MIEINFNLSKLTIRGYHEYKRIWKPKVKEELYCEQETFRNHYGSFAVAVKRYSDRETVGHAPREVSQFIKSFLTSETSRNEEVVARVTGLPFRNHGEEVPCDYLFKALFSITLDNLNSIKAELEETVKSRYGFTVRDFSAVAQTAKNDVPDIETLRHQYRTVLNDGKEIERTFRLMIIGCFSQGKTSLCRRLMGESIMDVISTEGIEVHKCTISKDGMWKKSDLNKTPEEKTISRLAAISSSSHKGEEQSATLQEERWLATRKLFDYTGNKCLKRTRSNDTVASPHQKMPKMMTDEESLSSTLCNPSNERLMKFGQQLHKFKTPASDEHIPLQMLLWDFGGQYEFYSTHQLFHSSKAVYLLVFDLRKDLGDIIEDREFPGGKSNSMENYIKFWVYSVHTFVGSFDGSEPRIILVGTHRDQVTKDVADKKFDKIKDLFWKKRPSRHIHDQHFAVNNLDNESDEEIKQLRGAIQQIAEERIKSIPIPAKWLLLENELNELQTDYPIISMTEVQRVNSAIDLPLSGLSEIKLFLNFQHTRGDWIYFGENVESEYVVLNPQYLIDAFKSIITSKRFCQTRPKYATMMETLLEEAKLEKDLLLKIWKKKGFLEHKDYLTKILEKHRIMTEALKFDTENASNIKAGFYYIPSLLKVDNIKDIKSFLKNKCISKVGLVYEFDNDIMLPTIYQQTTAAALAQWPLTVYGNKVLLFENVGVYQLIDNHAGLIYLNENQLQLTVVALCSDIINSNVACNFRMYVENVLKYVFRNFRNCANMMLMKNPYSEYLRCTYKKHEFPGSKRIQSVDEFKKMSKFPCPDNKSHTLFVRHVMKEWFPEDEIQRIPHKVLSENDIVKFVPAINTNWEMLGYQLGLKTEEIDWIKDDNRDNISMQKFDMLKKWSEKQKRKPTLDELIKEIENCKQLDVDKTEVEKIIEYEKRKVVNENKNNLQMKF